jgi:nucleoside-diphosphate-sugar epimerase
MTKHVVVGAGPTGSRVASLLAAEGEEVVLLSRRGGGPAHARIRRLAVDINVDDAWLTEARGAETLFQCAMPAYDRWPEDFPPLAASALRAVQALGARYVMLGNLYGYGPVEGPFREDMPLAPSSVKGTVRARLWEEARRTVRATEVRASDFLGRDVASMFTLMALPGLRTGQPVQVPADLDAAHSWSCTEDVARTLIAASRVEASFGRAWHVPSHELSWRALCDRMAGLLGAPAPQLQSIDDDALRAVPDPLVHALIEVAYLQRRPCVIDSRESERMLGVQRGELDRTLREMV